MQFLKIRAYMSTFIVLKWLMLTQRYKEQNFTKKNVLKCFWFMFKWKYKNSMDIIILVWIPFYPCCTYKSSILKLFGVMENGLQTGPWILASFCFDAYYSQLFWITIPKISFPKRELWQRF